MNRPTTFQGVSVCPRCGQTFKCGMAAGEDKCWCADLPHLPPPAPESRGCLCPACLRQAIAAAAQER